MSQTFVEKIAQLFAADVPPGKLVRAGDYLTIQPAYVMTHDNTGAVIPKFKSSGATRVANPRQMVFALDHNVQDKSEKNLEKYRKIEAFAGEQGIDFYPAGRGIGHQIMCEEGYAWPGTMVVASDSHSNMYGGLGCLGTPVVRTDAAAIWATGRTWWQVPPIARCELRGRLRPGVTGKDVIITLCGFFNKDEVLNHAVEFTGEGVFELNMNDRLTIANMTTEWGALAGVFPIDEITIEWLTDRAEYIRKRGLARVASDADAQNGEHPRVNRRRVNQLAQHKLTADTDAFYAKELMIELGTIVPHVSGPDTVKVMIPVTEIRKKRVRIDKAYLVSCVNSRVEDLAAASKIVKGKRVSDHVDFYIAAASSEVEAESQRRSDWRTLIEAGAKPLPPGCGPCIGLGAGLLEDREVGISATNRNFKGRMGSRNAQAYLASPEVVAASAIAGYIDMPDFDEELAVVGSVTSKERLTAEVERNKIIDGFPESLSGELIFCHRDNMNTDGIYPGKYTYIDDFTPEQQAQVVMENYDPGFGSLVKAGDILVGGFNFGTGSSREQAATALKYRGIKLVLAGSFSETYKRNALNNGFLAIEAPELVDDLKRRFGGSRLTVKTGLMATIDFAGSEVRLDGKSYRIGPVGAAAQELIVFDGLENWIRRKIGR